jgi:hypothetical protein
MEIGRRELVSSAVAIVLGHTASAAPEEAQQMYGLIGSMTAVSGRRDDLIAILTEAVSNMPGCLSFVVAKDSRDETIIMGHRGLGQKRKPRCITLVAVRDEGYFCGETDDLHFWQPGDHNSSGYGLPATKPQ